MKTYKDYKREEELRLYHKRKQAEFKHEKFMREAKQLRDYFRKRQNKSWIISSCCFSVNQS
jgi:hypothetical protein